MKLRTSLMTVAVVLAIALFSMVASAEDVATSDTKDGMLIHIKSGTDNPHSVLMGLSLALKMAEDTDVLVFFSVKGVYHVLKSSKDLEYGTFEKSGVLIKDLLENGAKLFACPMCLKAEGFTEEELKDGIGVMTKDQFFGFTNGRIVTLDFKVATYFTVIQFACIVSKGLGFLLSLSLCPNCREFPQSLWWRPTSESRLINL